MNRKIEETPRILTPDSRVRVFISSTIEELAEERKALYEAISAIKLIPVIFEAGARPYPPREVYQAYIEKSQIYVGVFWKSYGWISPDMKISGIEDEFNLSYQKPRLLYIREAPEGRDPKLEQLIQRIERERTISYKRFSTIEELVELVQNDIMQILSERFGLEIQNRRSPSPLPVYLQTLLVEMEKHKIIKREILVDEIQKEIDTDKILLVTGDPGIGKTYLLGELGAKLDAIYISLQNKTTQQVCSYLANHLSIRRGQIPQSLPSEDEAREALQEELANNSAVLLIDGADQNPTAMRVLIGLEFFDNCAIFAVRSSELNIFQGIAEFKVPPFDHSEIDSFLKLHKIDLSPGERLKLYSASKGNPLYLYYFTQYQISPLPEGLREYQRILWDRLSSLQQEVMNLVAHSFSLLNVSDIHTLLNASHVVSPTIMETKKLLLSAYPLIRPIEDCYEFFHPYFKEYVCSVANDDGLSQHYHQILAEHSIKQKRAVPAAFHLLKAGDPRMREYLLDASNVAIFQGNLLLAEEFLQHEIEFVKEGDNKHAEAYARYRLAQVYKEMGNYTDARDEGDRSLKLFEEVDDNGWINTVKLWASLLLIEEGRAEDTIKILVNVLEMYQDIDLFNKATIQLNLGYAYLRTSRFREGAEASQRALDIFTELDDHRGICASLVNLSYCIGELGERDLQRTYTENIIKVATERNFPRLKAAGLNHLAIVQRHEGDPVAAQHTLEECIEICQKIGCIETEILNITNLGNAYRDQRLYEQAEQAYTESLVKAREQQLPRLEAFALELLAHLKCDRGFHEDAIELGNSALVIHQKLVEPLRIASTQNYIARSHYKLGHKKEAAESYEDSGKHYEITGLWNEAAYNYEEAACLWNTLEQPERAFYCVSQGVKCAILSAEPDRAGRILVNVSPDEQGKQAGEFYLQTLQHFLKQPDRVSFTRFMYNFSIYCKQHHDPAEKCYFKSGIESIASTLTKNPPTNILNALAVGIEQATDSLYPTSDLDSLAECVANSIDHIYYRSIPDEAPVWTIGLDLHKPVIVQIVCLSDDPVVQRVSMALAFILLGNKDKIDSKIKELGENKEDSFSLQICMQRDFEENTEIKINSHSHSEAVPATITASNVPWGQQQPPTVLVLHDDYECAGDWARNPGNKAFVWVLMNVYAAFLAHCVHRNRYEVPEFGRISTKFCESVLL